MIIDLQRRLMEIGRLRIGQQVPTGNGKTRPAKLETWRFTSANEACIKQAAELYGGTVAPWQAPAGGQWEVITEAATLNVFIPPAEMAFSQHYELWSAGGCQRRCDGQVESISDGPCMCDPAARTCDIHSRLSVMLSELSGLGVWRVDTQGWYAACELSAAVEVIHLAAARGTLLPARLRLEQRQVKRPGPDGKSQTRKFAVPVLDIEVTPGQLLAAPGTGPLALPAGNGHTSNGVAKEEAVDGRAALDRAVPLTPVPLSVQHRPSGSVAEQMRKSTEPQEKPRRKNSAQPVPATGVEPRTAAQAQADIERDVFASVVTGDPGPIRQHLPGPTSDPVEKEEADGPGSVTAQQIRALHAGLTAHGFNGQKERDTVLQIVEILGGGRELTGPHKAIDGNPRTTKNLTRGEASKVIDHLKACDSQAAVWELVGQLDGDPVQGVIVEDP